MENITMNTVGVIHSPYKEPKDMPIQGIFKPETEALVELKEEFSNGMKDIGS